jgi:hypothetical protein
MKNINININNKLKDFLSSLKSRNLIKSLEPSQEKKDNKFIHYDFKVKYFLIFDKNGLLLINSPITEFAKLAAKYIEKLKLIVLKLCYLNIKIFEIFYRHSKVFFLNENFIYVCISSNKSNSCIIRLYLFFLNIIYLNLIGDNVKNSACLVNISKVFEVYFVPTLTTKFNKVIQYILSNKEKNSCRFLYKFKSLLIYYQRRNINIPLFDYRKIIYRKELQYRYNIRNNEKLFDTVNNLILCPVYNNNYVSQNEIYSHQIELYSTYPRWMIFGKFFKIYNGLNIIEIFTANKLSKITNTYKEFEIKQLTNEDDYFKVVSKHSYKLIRLTELFTFNYLETLSNIVNKYNNPKNELLYFDLDLLIVTNDVISLKLTEEALINLIYKRLQLYLIDKIKLGDRNSILMEEKNENSNSISNSNSKIMNNNNNINNKSKTNDNNYNEEDEYYDDESRYSLSTISKKFLQIESSDIFEEIYQKRKSLQLSSFESIDQVFNASEISESFQNIQNISYIRNLNNNTLNNDAYSLLSYKQNDSKRVSSVDIFSLFDKNIEESLNISKKPTEKQINLFREKRPSIGPTFNIIVNNHNSKGKKKLNKRKSFKSLKGPKNNLVNMKRKSVINNAIINQKMEREKRRNSFTESGLFLKQFYSMMSNSKFLKSKHQILKEIQNKIASMKRNNSLKDLQAEIKLKNNSPFSKPSLQNAKIKNKELSNEDKTSEHNIHLIKNSSSYMYDDNENSINKDYGKGNGGDLIHEYYGDKSSSNFIQKNEDTVFKKLNQKY